MQRVGVPGPRCKAILDQSIPNLYEQDVQSLRLGIAGREFFLKSGTHISRSCGNAVLVDLDKILDGLKENRYTMPMTQ